MKQKNNSSIVSIIVIFAIIFLPSIISFFNDLSLGNESVEDDSFRIISSTSNRFMEDELYKYGRKNDIDIQIDYYGDLEIVDILNSNNNYDAVWISNSIWLYMLNNSYLVTDSKSIAINPVVMAVKKDKAEALGLTSGNVKNKDILDLIRDRKLNYVMSSVTKTNTGATAYLGFLNSIAGSPEILSEEMLSDPNLISDMKTFFTGVERVSGDEEYLEDMFVNGDFDAIVNYESTLIDLNKRLVSEGKEPLYLVYPVDGVAINDMPFGYVNRDQNKKEQFEVLLKFLRSEQTSEILEDKGYRTWYGGTKNNTDKGTFNDEWGINTSNYLIPLKYPSKKVISAALDLYVEQLRKPTHVVFCLDLSGSMSGDGLSSLTDAMMYILDKEEASKDRLQFSPYDKISIITFESRVNGRSNTYTGDNTEPLKSFMNSLWANGGTNIYDPSIEALKILEDTDDSYTKTVILMTDGIANAGSYYELESYYKSHNLNIPIYSIMFGYSHANQLNDIANLTNAKVFDGKEGLKKAFAEVRSYN